MLALRICLMTPELLPYKIGGIGTYIAALAEEFGRRGHTVDVVGCDIHPGEPVVTHPWGRSISLLTANHPLGWSGARAIEAAIRGLYLRRVPFAWRVYSYAVARSTIASAILLRRFVRRRDRQYDVIEYPNWPGHAGWLPPQKRGAYVARLSTSATTTGLLPVALALERKAVRRADAVVAHSHAMARKGEELYGLPAGRVRVIPLGLADAPIGKPSVGESVRLVCVGRAEERKGTDLLISALAVVLPSHPKATFRFVGPGLPEYLHTRPDVRAAWERLIAECPGRVENLGQVSEADRERAVGQAHWLIAPSRFESFGLVAVEAMRAGTPVVYAAAGGLEEVGSTCSANVVVRSDSTEDLARAIGEVCRNGPAAALAARPASRRAFEESFSAGVMAERTLELYRAALEGRA
jgi:glycosyltransferase involved in cell wall biosynthesis